MAEGTPRYCQGSCQDVAQFMWIRLLGISGNTPLNRRKRSAVVNVGPTYHCRAHITIDVHLPVMLPGRFMDSL